MAGWQPRRTIIFAHWDAGDFGQLGSYEWVEVGHLLFFTLDIISSHRYRTLTIVAVRNNAACKESSVKKVLTCFKLSPGYPVAQHQLLKITVNRRIRRPIYRHDYDVLRQVLELT